jgi:hypothetical protein
MVKTIAVDDDFHLELKLEATKNNKDMKYYLVDMFNSHKRLSKMATDLANMSDSDVYRLVLDDKVILLACTGVHDIQN